MQETDLLGPRPQSGWKREDGVRRVTLRPKRGHSDPCRSLTGGSMCGGSYVLKVVSQRTIRYGQRRTTQGSPVISNAPPPPPPLLPVVGGQDSDPEMEGTGSNPQADRLRDRNSHNRPKSGQQPGSLSKAVRLAKPKALMGAQVCLSEAQARMREPRHDGTGRARPRHTTARHAQEDTETRAKWDARDPPFTQRRT